MSTKALEEQVKRHAVWCLADSYNAVTKAYGKCTCRADQAASELKEILDISETNANDNAKLWKDNIDLTERLAKAQEYGDHWQEIAQAETKKLAAKTAEVDKLAETNLKFIRANVETAKDNIELRIENTEIREALVNLLDTAWKMQHILQTHNLDSGEWGDAVVHIANSTFLAKCPAKELERENVSLMASLVEHTETERQQAIKDAVLFINKHPRGRL